jgi:hypothetical protein
VQDVILCAPGFRVIETTKPQPDERGRLSYAVVDKGSGIIWLWAGTPEHEKRSIVSEARQAAAVLVRLPVLPLTS